MALRMIIFICEECGHEFEELVDTEDGKADPIPCEECGNDSHITTDFSQRVHRDGNKYRHVSWSLHSV
jgi:putative FmdB family regulatory protein